MLSWWWPLKVATESWCRSRASTEKLGQKSTKRRWHGSGKGMETYNVIDSCVDFGGRDRRVWVWEMGRRELSAGSHLWQEEFAKMDMMRWPEADYIEVSESRILNFIIKENYLILSNCRQIWETGWHVLVQLAVLIICFFGPLSTIYCQLIRSSMVSFPLAKPTQRHNSKTKQGQRKK